MFKTRLKKRRTLLNITKEDLASKALTTQSRISKYERGEDQPGMEEAANLASALDCSLTWLIRGKGATESGKILIEVTKDQKKLLDLLEGLTEKQIDLIINASKKEDK